MTIHPFEYDRDEEGDHPCCICAKTTKGDRHVVLNHVAGDWPEPGDDDEDLSIYPIGPECARRVKMQGIEIIQGEPK